MTFLVFARQGINSINNIYNFRKLFTIFSFYRTFATIKIKFSNYFHIKYPCFPFHSLGT